MVNIKSGVIGAIATFVLILMEAILLPIALGFLVGLNNSVWLTANDRAILAYSGTLTVVTILFTFIGGMIGSVFLAVSG